MAWGPAEYVARDAHGGLGAAAGPCSSAVLLADGAFQLGSGRHYWEVEVRRNQEAARAALRAAQPEPEPA